MTAIMQTWLSGLIPPGLAARGTALTVCALVMCCASPRSVVAQSSKLHAAFEVVEASNSEPSEPSPGTVRLVSGQQQPVQPPKTATPPARKPAAKKATPVVTPETHLPEKMEPLPPGPMKAVLPLAGSASTEGLQLTQDDKDKGLITLIVRDTPLSQVIARLAQQQQLNIVAANDIDVLISITLKRVPRALL